jgi:hypothetical protein
MYGLLLVVMMLVRPEGFLPEARRQQELRAHVDEAIDVVAAAAVAAKTTVEADQSKLAGD